MKKATKSVYDERKALGGYQEGGGGGNYLHQDRFKIRTNKFLEKCINAVDVKLNVLD